MPGGRYPWAVRAGGPLLGESAPPDPTIIWTWSPISNQPLPGGETFTRASVKQEFNGSIYNELASGVIPENSAAFGGGSQGFHPEPAATNQIPESQDLSASTWSKTNLTISDQGIGDLGLQVFRCDAGTTNGFHRALEVVPVGGAGSAYCITEGVTGRYLSIRRGGGDDDYATFDLQLGTITEEGAGINDALITDFGNEWYKCEINTSDTATGYAVEITDTGTPGQARYVWTPTNETVDVCQNQWETTIFSTSPIITAGAQGTRIADVLDIGIVIATAFSALLDLTLPIVVGAGNTISLLGADATATDILRVDDAGNVIMDDGGTPVTIGTATLGTRIKIAYGRDATGRSASLDGATAVTGGAPSAAHEGNTFQLGSTNSVNQSRSIHHVSTLYDVRKSDAELENLSS